jgi:hypothetical protein
MKTQLNEIQIKMNNAETKIKDYESLMIQKDELIK